MLRMCGRAKLSPDEAWSMTPREFECVLEGHAEHERFVMLEHAKITSVVLSMGGVRASPLSLIGEAQDEDDPLGPPSPEEAHGRHLELMEAQRSARFAAYLGEGDSEDGAP
jgi:hypothetical protein